MFWLYVVLVVSHFGFGRSLGSNCPSSLSLHACSIVDQLPRLGKRELICLLLFTCNYAISVWRGIYLVSVWRGFLLLLVLGMGYVISLWHSLSLPYNYFVTLNDLL